MDQQDLAEFCAQLEQLGRKVSHARADNIISPSKVDVLTDDGTWHEYRFPASMTTQLRLQSYDRYREQRRSSVSSLRLPKF
jgi:hypothetical protein